MKKYIFNDPSNGIINLRYFTQLVQCQKTTDFSEKEEKDFLSLVLLIAIKLAAVWSHKEKYSEIEIQLINKARTNPVILGKIDNQIELSQDLFIEFDEFLYQVKSCLDHLVKILTVCLGKKVWSIETFRNKGEKVKKTIGKCFPVKFRPIGQALILHIEDNEFWLKEIIAARDKITHFLDGGISYENFTVFIKKNGNDEKLIFPTWAPQQTIKQLMEVVWNNLLFFSEDFSHLSLLLRCRKENTLFKSKHSTDTSPSVSPWKYGLKTELFKSPEYIIALQKMGK